ncbi:MAG: vWA domain-containing protein, partial [Halobacteria archaeon]|nr:vWA domain-containing protein [Halobacteria archaeon]
EELLGNSGNIILISDGIANDPAKGIQAARRIAAKDINLITIGVGSRTNEEYMSRLAEAGSGTFLRATQTSRLRVFFGGNEKQPQGSGLTIVNTGHFITSGVNTTANPPKSNTVSVKGGGEYLVASGTGSPALVSGRYGLGRVVSITAYGNDGTLDGLLSKPDSLLLSRSVNWAIGDPERKLDSVVQIPDTAVGQPTRVTYIGSSRPSFGDLQFSRTGEREFTATFVPTQQGVKRMGGTQYAVNYASEYSAFGMSSQVGNAVATTGGKIFEPGQAEAIAEAVKSRSTRQRQVQEEWDWLFLLLGLLLYLVEVSTRRLQEVYGYTLRQRFPNIITNLKP